MANTFPLCAHKLFYYPPIFPFIWALETTFTPCAHIHYEIWRSGKNYGRIENFFYLSPIIAVKM